MLLKQLIPMRKKRINRQVLRVALLCICLHFLSCEYESEVSLSETRPFIICSKDGFPIKTLSFGIKQKNETYYKDMVAFSINESCINVDSLLLTKNLVLEENQEYSVYVKTSKGRKGVNFTLKNNKVVKE